MSRSVVLDLPQKLTRPIDQASSATAGSDLYPSEIKPDAAPRRTQAPFPADKIEAHTFNGRTETFNYFSTDGVGILALNSANPNPRAIEDLLKLVEKKAIRSVMIADTIPNDGIKKLALALDSRGVRVYFVDHHDEEIFADAKSAWGPISNHWALKSALGGRCITAGRNEAPSVSHLCEKGFAKEKKIELIIGGHPDIDFIASALWFVGSDPRSLGEESDLPTPDLLGVVDSPNTVRSRAIRMGLRQMSQRAKGDAAGEIETTLPAWLEEARQLMDLQDPVLRRDAQMALAGATKQGNLTGDSGALLHQLSLQLTWERGVIGKLFLNYVEDRGPRPGIFALDLDAILRNKELPLDEVFSDKKELQFIKGLLSDPAASLEEFSVVMKQSNKLPNDGVVIFSKTDEYGRRTTLIEAFGVYRFRGDAGAANHFGVPSIDFREVAKVTNVRLRSRIGQRAFLDGEPDARLLDEVGKRMSVIDIADEKRRWGLKRTA